MSRAKQPGHIPIGAQSNDHSAYLAGVDTRKFFTDALAFAKVQMLVTEYYRFDLLSNFWDVYNVEAEALGQPVLYHPGGIPDVDRSRQLLASRSDLDRLRPPDPRKAGRLPWVLEFNRLFKQMTGKLERVYFTAPFSLAVNIRGYENLIYDMADDPAWVHRLFVFLCDEVIAPFMETLRDETGTPGLIMDGRDAWASPPMITLDMVDEYVVAYTERLRDRLGKGLITRGNWGDAKCEEPERFFAQKLKCCPGVLSVLDPDLYEVGPERVKSFAGRMNAAVAAGVDAKLIRQGPAEAVMERVRLYIDKLARDGRLLIHLNHIPAETPPQHIHAAVAACHLYGRLPVAGDLERVEAPPPQRETFQEFLEEKGESLDSLRKP